LSVIEAVEKPVIVLPPVMAPFSIIRVALPRDRPCPLAEA
jgi:hypothetical protein